ncbi:hypothetical protein B0J14DRAFT_129150 [Halenospora varia]|nr:hypothetical protein B0J14DRAFT_129150 [Halenospora varia]
MWPSLCRNCQEGSHTDHYLHRSRHGRPSPRAVTLHLPHSWRLFLPLPTILAPKMPFSAPTTVTVHPQMSVRSEVWEQEPGRMDLTTTLCDGFECRGIRVDGGGEGFSILIRRRIAILFPFIIFYILCRGNYVKARFYPLDIKAYLVVGFFVDTERLPS